ncbi:hypothetical protein, partial [Rheinheimera baltica]|uniref:hypothetical protein n=1 Tax=Rheinheimera baltica TaxID=67576 RepID=UPI00273E7647
MISDVDVVVCENKITAKVILGHDATNADTEFAYYVYKNKQRVHVEWYSDSKIFQYEFAEEPALYCIQAFVRTPTGAVISKVSQDILVNKVVADVPDYSRLK